VIDEGTVLDLDSIAESDSFVDEGVATDDAFGPKACAGSEDRPIPNTGSGADGDIGFDLGGRVNPRRGVDHEELL
jgi:hypothetical protein